MEIKAQKWGNSCGIRIPNSILKSLNIKQNDALIIKEENDFKRDEAIGNEITNIIIVCPITNNIKDFPTHFVLNSTKKIKGTVLCEHLRSIDPESRNIKFVERLNNFELDNILSLIKSFYD